MSPLIRIGTRGSKLALWQARWVSSELKKKNPGLEIILVPIKTTGDKLDNEDLLKIGGKGLFIKEIEESLLNEKIDLAVHSLKDIPAEIPRGLRLASIPFREEARDVLVSKNHQKLMHLPSGSRVGTSSLRRIYQLKRQRGDLDYAAIRGNIDTRLKKLQRQEYDALVLAAAGLMRLGFKEEIAEYLSIVPAVGQGALGLEIRLSDKKTGRLTALLDDSESAFCTGVERIFLREFGADCDTPLGCHVTLEGGQVCVDIFLCQPDGSGAVTKSLRVSRDEAMTVIKKLAKEIQINDFCGMRNFWPPR